MSIWTCYSLKYIPQSRNSTGKGLNTSNRTEHLHIMSGATTHIFEHFWSKDMWPLLSQISTD
uniref:Uncharacterized protein n=1 Tax=Lepeophtheirus salmonis TaxID=72036 RepID=A0A0K2USR6_LEPSM